MTDFIEVLNSLGDDPKERFHELQQCPVARVASNDSTVRSVLRDDDTWSSKFGPGLSFGDPTNTGTVLVSSDPPIHTDERIAISRLFKPSTIEAMGPDILLLVDGLLDHIADRGEGDLIRDLAMALPLTVMCWMLGTPVEDIEQFRNWVMPMAEGVALPAGRNADHVRDAYVGFYNYFNAHIAARRIAIDAGDDAPDDLLTRLLTVEREGRRLSEAQVLGFCQFLMVAGSATTTLLIGNLVSRLLEHPDQLALVIADRTLVANAIEESLRLDAPVHGLFRTNNCPVELNGETVPADSKVLVMFGAANIDPDLWVDPDRFDITRDLQQLRRNVAFGHGIHYCLGAPLARLEATVALNRVLDRLPGLRRSGPSESVAAAVLHGFETFPIDWKPAI